MAFLREYTEGALSGGGRLRLRFTRGRGDVHGFLERLFVDWHLDGDMGQVDVDEPVGCRWDGRVVL